MIAPAELLAKATICKQFSDAHTSNRRYRLSTKAFIAAQIIDRVMWKMRSDGASLTKISIVVELNKSNVKRRLDKMRAPRQAEVNHDWCKTYDGLFGIPA